MTQPCLVWMDHRNQKQVLSLQELQQQIQDGLAFKQALDEALIASGLDCLGPKDSPREALNKLLVWHQQMALDPAVSREAQKLIDQGALDKAEPNMFWNDADPESSRGGIFQIVDVAYGKGAVNMGDVMTIRQAIRLPNIKVRVIPMVDDPGYPDYEVVEESNAQG